MSLKFKSGKGLRNVMQEDFYLQVNPFNSASIYDPANPGSYEPRMYGAASRRVLPEVFSPARDEQAQVIGAIWSSQLSSDWRGFGKSMLMAEESKRICRDLASRCLGNWT